MNQPKEQSYKCLCENRWQGKYCTEDVDECGSSENARTRYYDICSGYGGCHNVPGSFTCTCLPGRFGAKCDMTVADFPHFLDISVEVDGVKLSEMSGVYQLKYGAF